MDFSVLYDSTSYAFKTYIPKIITVLFVVVGIILLVLIKKRKVDYSRFGPIVLLVFGTVFTLLLSLKVIGENKFIIQPYLEGKYSVVEGYPVELTGIDTTSGSDTFYIDGVYFVIGGTDGPGLKTRAYQGGPIDSKENYYRITYVEYADYCYIFKVEILIEN